jgi:alkylation response protein AidB-like acyl-CoA dehydrogenase
MSMTRAELQDSARRAFGDGKVAADPQASWALIAEMGWLMLAVPEDQGGLGLGREAAGVIHAELGRALIPGPAIAQLLAIEALAQAGQGDLLARAMGGAVVTMSLLPPSVEPVVSGVIDADRASHLVVDRIDAIYLVPIADCTLAPRQTWDETRRLFDVTVPDGAGTILVEGMAAWELSERIQSDLLFALSADALGGADTVLAMTVDYLKTRRQFDRPLALFQALKHRLADLKCRLAAVEALLWSRATGDATLAQLGALKALATTTYRDIAEEAIQLHGGIGLTEEHPCHRYLKRAFLDCALGGDADLWDEAAGRAALEPDPNLRFG